MKSKVLLFLITLFVLISEMKAATVTQTDAQNVALNFFKITLGSNLPRTPLTASLVYTRTESDGIVDFYVFTMSPSVGFVIVAADDNDGPIIGYSTEATFSPNFSNTGLSDYLGRWGEEIHYVALNNVLANTLSPTRWTAYRQGANPGYQKASSLGPLCQTTWDQFNESGSTPVLYNTYCPGTGSNQAVTGCVATTMAQIMRYWKYPAQGSGGNVCYTDGGAYFQMNYGQLCFNFTNFSFDWADMPTQLTNSSSSTQIDAVGNLMYAAGVTVNMDYSPNGSGAVVETQEAGGGACAQKAYVQNFGYDASTIAGYLESTYTGNWTTLIENDLNAGRLVEYQGTDATQGGHTWVCDGYDQNNNLHMNWGWSGAGDGYYATTSLVPTQSGQSLGFNFSKDLGVLVGIQPPPGSIINVSATVANNSVCPGSGTTISASGPASATYSWSPTTNLTCSTCASTTASPAATTTYTVTADSAGITATASVTVNVNAAIVPGAGSITGVSCYGGSNGSLTISATGGSGGFTYSWSNGQTTSTINNLAAGTYKVTITDVKGCSATASKSVSQPTQIVGTITPTNASCGTSNGRAVVAASGGGGSYTYRWSNSQTTAAITGLSAGNYTVTITDAHSCTASAATSISSGGNLNPSITATNINCYGTSTGSVTASASGGTGNLQYAWSNGGNTATLSNIPAGNYVVTISDGSGCSVTTSKTVSQPASAVTVLLTSSNASCNQANGSVSAAVTGGISGYSYNWSTGATSIGISGLGAGAYQITVHDANSCSTSAAVTLTSSSGLNASATITAVACYGGANGNITLNISGGTGNLSYAWSNGGTSASISNLAPGSYTATVNDGGACSATVTEIVSQPSAVSISLLPSGAACGSADGGVSAAVTGGNSGYTYSWSNGGSGASISGLNAGTYTLTVSDTKGCTATATAVVSSSASLALNPAVHNITCYGQTNGTATVSAGNGTSPYSYLWSDGASTAAISNLTAGLYLVTVTDAHNCSSSASVTITQPAQIAITASSIGCSAGQNNGSSAVTNVTGGNGSYSYEWSNGDNTQTINNLAPGTYEVTVSDKDGCQNTAQALVSGATGINDVSSDISFSMYPNPASSDLIVSVTKLNGNETTLAIRNMLGQQMIFKPITEIQNHVDVSGLAGGLYLVELRQGEKSAVRQLVVTR